MKSICSRCMICKDPLPDERKNSIYCKPCYDKETLETTRTILTAISKKQEKMYFPTVDELYKQRQCRGCNETLSREKMIEGYCKTCYDFEEARLESMQKILSETEKKDTICRECQTHCKSSISGLCLSCHTVQKSNESLRDFSVGRCKQCKEKISLFDTSVDEMCFSCYPNYHMNNFLSHIEQESKKKEEG